MEQHQDTGPLANWPLAVKELDIQKCWVSTARGVCSKKNYDYPDGGIHNMVTPTINILPLQFILSWAPVTVPVSPSSNLQKIASCFGAKALTYWLLPLSLNDDGKTQM